MKTITPFLWFENQAEKAAKFYVSVFGGKSKVVQVTRYGDGAPGKKGSVMTVVFTLNGQRFVALNGGQPEEFNNAVSFFIECDNQREIDHFWKKLSKGGKEIQCGWLQDRYGLRWQVVPANLHRLLDAKHPERASRVLQAVMGMVKLDMAELERAYRGR